MIYLYLNNYIDCLPEVFRSGQPFNIDFIATDWKSKNFRVLLHLKTILNMDNIVEQINSIKESILKFVPAKYIYLFGSYAYGNPTEDSDIDIYVVTPDSIDNFSELYAKIVGDLREKEIFFIDLLFGRESVFNIRKVKNMFEKTIIQKGKLIYGN
jgi:predicted nucleotidyltransferase